MNLKEQLKKCDELYENSDYARLIEKCDEILKEYPDNQNAMGYKGISHCFLGQYDEARKILERGVELYPENYYLKNNLAMVYYDLGEYEASLKLCEEGLEIRNFSWLCKNKIKALIKLNRMDEAKEFERTMGHSFNIADVYLEEGMIDDALNCYYNILKDNPGDYNTIEMIKLIICHYDLNAVPEVGDFYLTWIDSINYNQDYEGLDSNSGNPELNGYSTIKIIDFGIALKKFKGNIRLDELKEKLPTYDGREFDALISKLLEIGYLERADENQVRLSAKGSDDKLEELKRQTVMDNSHLEELIRQDITPEMEREVFEVLKKSRLFLPVDFGADAFKGIEDAKPGDTIEGPEGFSIQFLTDANGNKAVPLFTSEDMMKEAGARTSVMAIYMEDLADMLKQTDRYSVVSINPLTEFELNIPIGAFLAQFNDEDELEIADIKNDKLRKLLQQKDLSDDELKEFSEELLSSIMIAGCVDADEGTSFVLIWNADNKPHLPLFTDLNEFEKIFSNYKEDVYPQAYNFTDLIKVANEDLVINPASESLILNPKMFKE